MGRCPRCGDETAGAFCPRDGTPVAADAPAPDDPFLGRVVNGRYRLEKVAGRGAFGIVYRATHLALNTPFAIKVIPPVLLQAQPDMAERFLREARIASSLRHPNTIRVSDFGKMDDGALYLVMEWLEGRTLSAEFARSGRMEPGRMLRVAAQVCGSLDEAHQNGVVHRDLKPANIFLCDGVGQEDFVKVLDFGIAKVVRGEGMDSTLTHGREVLGTPAYMAPEQAKRGQVGPATDLYALGVILYKGLTGMRPFDGGSPMAVALAHMTEPVPEMDPGALGLPPRLCALVRGLMAKDPGDRPQPVSAVAREIEGILASLEPGTEGGPTPRRVWRRVRVALVVGAAVALGVALGLAAYSAYRGGAGVPAVGMDVAVDEGVEEAAQDTAPDGAVTPDEGRAVDSRTASDLAVRGTVRRPTGPRPGPGATTRPAPGREVRPARGVPGCSPAWCRGGEGQRCEDSRGRAYSRDEYCLPGGF